MNRYASIGVTHQRPLAAEHFTQRNIIYPLFHCLVTNLSLFCRSSQCFSYCFLLFLIKKDIGKWPRRLQILRSLAEPWLNFRKVSDFDCFVPILGLYVYWLLRNRYSHRRNLCPNCTFQGSSPLLWLSGDPSRTTCYRPPVVEMITAVSNNRIWRLHPRIQPVMALLLCAPNSPLLPQTDSRVKFRLSIHKISTTFIV